MSAAADAIGPQDGGKAAGGRRGGRGKLLLLAVPLALLAAGGGLAAAGVVHLPFLSPATPAAAGGDPARSEPARPPVFADLPELVANLNAGPRRSAFVKLRAKVELAQAEDQAGFAACQPRVLDLLQTYLREMRPEELRGAAGTYRLREELVARTDIACAPLRVRDILFTELLTQ